jgi:hypothetical protein
MMIAELAVVLLVPLQYFDFFHLLCGIARGCGGSRDDNGEYKLREVHDDADMIIVLLRVDLNIENILRILDIMRHLLFMNTMDIKS